MPYVKNRNTFLAWMRMVWLYRIHRPPPKVCRYFVLRSFESANPERLRIRQFVFDCKVGDPNASRMYGVFSFLFF